MKFVYAALLLLAVPFTGQATADPVADDPRFRTIEFEQGGLFHLQTSPETTQTVMFAPGEVIKSIIVSEPNAYAILVSGTGDSLTVKANGPASLAIMSVKTDLRSYEFELAAGDTGAAPNVVRFSFGRPARPDVRPAGPVPQVPDATWRLSGNKEIRPATITDDGKRTYLAWRDDQAMPAIFAVSSSGQEEMVDGYVRDGLFTIDRVNPQLIFRMDREMATARREVRRKRHD